MNKYRVFVTRHYIAVEYFDIEADNVRQARNAARKAAYAISPDPRATATDNGWIPDSKEDVPVISELGYPNDIGDMVQVFQDPYSGAIVYQPSDKVVDDD